MKEGKKDTGTKALMEQRCFNQHGVGILTLTIHKTIPIRERELQTITYYCMAHKKEEGTYHLNEKCLDSSALGKVCLSS